MSHRRHFFAACTILAASAGCGPPANDTAQLPTGQAQVNGPKAPAPSAGGAAASVLRFAQGIWLSDCRVLPFRSPFRTKLTFASMSVTHESSVYQDPQCRQLLSTWKRGLTVTKVHRKELENERGVELELTVHASSVGFTTFNGYGAIAGPACGLANWIDGVTRDVSGRQCGPGRLDTMGRESTLTLTHDPDFGTLNYQGDLLRLQ